MATKSPKVDLRTIEDYIFRAEGKVLLSFIPHGATNVRVSKLSKWSMTVNNVYSISVAYTAEGLTRTQDFILKLYPDGKKRCQKEHNILKVLENADFPVPHVFIKEMNEKLFGASFLVMEKVEGKTLRDCIKHADDKEIFKIIKHFAETLAHLHELKWKEIGLTFLGTAKSKLYFAEKQALSKNKLPDYVNKKGFEWATNWLKNSAQKHPCNHYSLIRNDMNLNNCLVTQKGEITLLDWEWAEIGDPLKDVGHAYHNIRHTFGIRNINRKGRKFASYFIRRYIEKSSRKIDLSALRFYMFSAGLKEAIYLRYVKEKIKYPSFFVSNFGIAYFPFIPFIWWYYRSRYKRLEQYLRREAIDYEQAMFETLGGKILSTIEVQDVTKFLEAKPSELILDIGAGSGRISRRIVSEMKANLIAIDAERLAIQFAKKRGESLTGYELVIADGQYLPFKDSVINGIICIRALKYFPDYTLGISEMSRVLRSGGRLVVDLSSELGYESVFRHVTRTLSARGSHVFNFYKMKNLLGKQRLSIVNSVSLQKIPHKVWNLSANPEILHLLIVSEFILRKISPLMLSRSILVKCVKHHS